MEQFWAQNSHILVALLANFVFGLGYSFLIAWLNRKSMLEGYTAIAVVFGCFITLIINQLMHNADLFKDLVFELAGFVASGTPMIINNLREAYLAKLDERAAIAEVVSNGQ